MATSTAPYYGSAIQGTNASDQNHQDDNRDIYPEIPQQDEPAPYSVPSGNPHNANQDRPDGQDVEMPHNIIDGQLSNLVEAAAAAAGQESRWAAQTDRQLQDTPTQRRSSRASGHDGIQEKIFDHNGIPNIGINGGLNRDDGAQARPRKRRRASSSEAHGDSALMNALSQNMQPNPPQVEVREFPPQQSISDARAAGVHSAAALFRQPSASSKKYTRPPMSKMFADLELSPENFLHLQAAAKAYMLNDVHPERRDCVGQRGKGDSEMVKLRLWNCVKAFLEDEGNGERYFGLSAEASETRRLLWPKDEARIITLVIPLLRRMVTNERQRMYAIETRKGGGQAEKKRKVEAENSPSPHQQHPEQNFFNTNPQSPPIAFMGATLQQQIERLPMPFPPPRQDSDHTTAHLSDSSEKVALSRTPTPQCDLIINILVGNRRVCPRVDIPSTMCPDLASLKKKVNEIFPPERPDNNNESEGSPERDMKVKVWMPDGRVEVESDSDWTLSLLNATVTEWMDGEIWGEYRRRSYEPGVSEHALATGLAIIYKFQIPTQK
ncbi:MAG: hypothetical protein M1834_001685 [Cirrosporium novae-zelandiae]|nr:MAG: hypothetical protein M1834_001685 [Cirrosporium novae-zelandiae]